MQTEFRPATKIATIKAKMPTTIKPIAHSGKEDPSKAKTKEKVGCQFFSKQILELFNLLVKIGGGVVGD